MIPKHDKAFCVNCGKEYMKSIKGCSRNQSKMLRQSNTINCSRKCSREYKDTKQMIQIHKGGTKDEE